MRPKKEFVEEKPLAGSATRQKRRGRLIAEKSIITNSLFMGRIKHKIEAPPKKPRGGQRKVEVLQKKAEVQTTNEALPSRGVKREAREGNAHGKCAILDVSSTKKKSLSLSSSSYSASPAVLPNRSRIAPSLPSKIVKKIASKPPPRLPIQQPKQQPPKQPPKQQPKQQPPKQEPKRPQRQPSQKFIKVPQEQPKSKNVSRMPSESSSLSLSPEVKKPSKATRNSKPSKTLKKIELPPSPEKKKVFPPPLSVSPSFPPPVPIRNLISLYGDLEIPILQISPVDTGSSVSTHSALTETHQTKLKNLLPSHRQALCLDFMVFLVNGFGLVSRPKNLNNVFSKIESLIAKGKTIKAVQLFEIFASETNSLHT